VRLGKTDVLKVYYFCREAERSVHRALSDPWPDFLAYYAPSRRADILATTELMNSLLGRSGLCREPPTRNEIEKLPLRVSLWRACFGRWLARWERSWSFSPPEVCFIAAVLTSLLRLLDELQKPAAEALIDLRLSFCDCQWIIERHSHGLPELRLADEVDHFNKTDSLPRVSLSDVLKKSA
jgi:hypothetical protein